MAKRKTIEPLDDDPKQGVLSRLRELLEDLVSKIPISKERPTSDPRKRAREIVNSAAARAAFLSGGLALPPGPVGLLTMIPDLLGIWKIQRQMVADIAAVFGLSADLSREVMFYCLFKHAAAHLVRDLVVRVGERYAVKRASLRAMQKAIEKVAVKVTQKIIAKRVAVWLPIIGAAGVGAYAYYDTAQVGKTAIDVFSAGFGGDAEANSQ